VGKTAVYKNYHSPAVFASYLIRVRMVKDAYNPDMLSFFINSFYGRKYIGSVVSQQVGQANVNGTKLSQMPIPLPPLAEQRRIVAEVERRLSIADKIAKTVEQSLAQAERLRQSILKKAFEGKLVAQDANDEPAGVLPERIKAERARMSGGKKKDKALLTL
jgi:type I restriction enzyme S subunit